MLICLPLIYVKTSSRDNGVEYGTTPQDPLFPKEVTFPFQHRGKIRTLNVVRYLAKWHDITYLCNVSAEEQPYLQDMQELGVRLEAMPWHESPRHSPMFYAGLAVNLLSSYPYTVNKDFDSRLRRRAQELIKDNPPDLIICDFVQMARNTLGLNGPPQILFQHNVEAEIYDRMAKNESNWFKRLFILNQYKKMRAFESAAGRSFNRIIAVSQRDQKAFEKNYGWKHVNCIDTGVDTNFFTPLNTNRDDHKIVFVGSMDWMPNQEGVLRFANKILPELQKRIPSLTFEIVGRNPSAAIRKLAELPGVTVTGSVDDVRPYVARAAAAVIPLYAGGGTRLKIFEFMAMGTPIVSTTLGAEGLSIDSGKHLLIADSDQHFADAVEVLLRDAALRDRLALEARQLVLKKFSAEAIARQFEAICKSVVNSAVS